MEEWGRWMRENFDKLLLAALVLFMLCYQVHLIHHASDASLASWAREQTNTFSGALIGLITGHALASRTIATAPGGGSVVTKTETK